MNNKIDSVLANMTVVRIRNLIQHKSTQSIDVNIRNLVAKEIHGPIFLMSEIKILINDKIWIRNEN